MSHARAPFPTLCASRIAGALRQQAPLPKEVDRRLWSLARPSRAPVSQEAFWAAVVFRFIASSSRGIAVPVAAWLCLLVVGLSRIVAVSKFPHQVRGDHCARASRGGISHPPATATQPHAHTTPLAARSERGHVQRRATETTNRRRPCTCLVIGRSSEVGSLELRAIGVAAGLLR